LYCNLYFERFIWLHLKTVTVRKLTLLFETRELISSTHGDLSVSGLNLPSYFKYSQATI
jgi:hypothetical protein